MPDADAIGCVEGGIKNTLDLPANAMEIAAVSPQFRLPGGNGTPGRLVPAWDAMSDKRVRFCGFGRARQQRGGLPHPD
jgi:hypothetical protein